jgi:glycerol-3-phosphate dehydrogenase
MTEIFDLAIIGGGVNGCGIARDAAGRGHSVVLFEKGDLASATSQASTKLIHGGLRYLEYYKFRLVRESLAEREILMRIAPHIVAPLRFVLPHHAGLRPAWFLRLGLFIYDHLGGRKLLPPTTTIDLAHDPAGAPLKPGYRKAFEYSDGWVDDARLVILNARDAADRGAAIHTRSKVISARREGASWRIEARGPAGGTTGFLARALVNAAGPWVAELLSGVVHTDLPARVRLVQGSHIVVKQLFAHDRAYIFQNADGRIIFAIPFRDDYTLIGTTDLDYHGDPGAAAITEAEIAYLCGAASEYFAAGVRPADVVWSYSGVRPLYDDGASKAQEATRDYVLKLDAPAGAPALLSIFGGKITTYRRLAETVLAQLAPHLPAARGLPEGWTARAPLPGGDFPVGDAAGVEARLAAAHPFLSAGHARRLVRAYGTRAFTLLDGARDAAALGRGFGADLTERELEWMVTQEWAATAEDTLWRRSKLGLRLTPAEASAVAEWLAARAV